MKTRYLALFWWQGLSCVQPKNCYTLKMNQGIMGSAYRAGRKTWVPWAQRRWSWACSWGLCTDCICSGWPRSGRTRAARIDCCRGWLSVTWEARSLRTWPWLARTPSPPCVWGKSRQDVRNYVKTSPPCLEVTWRRHFIRHEFCQHSGLRVIRVILSSWW